MRDCFVLANPNYVHQSKDLRDRVLLIAIVIIAITIIAIIIIAIIIIAIIIIAMIIIIAVYEVFCPGSASARADGSNSVGVARRSDCNTIW